VKGSTVLQGKESMDREGTYTTSLGIHGATESKKGSLTATERGEEVQQTSFVNVEAEERLGHRQGMGTDPVSSRYCPRRRDAKVNGGRNERI